MSSLSRVNRSIDGNWVHSVKKLLCSCGFGDVWYSQGVDDPAGFSKAFKTRLMDMFRQEWSYRLTESSRALFFREIKTDHVFSNFLDVINVKSHRIALTRLIASSHCLRVETDRWLRPKPGREQRLCTSCNKIGDEYHLLLECQLFVDIKKILPRYFWVRSSMQKRAQLLNSTNKKTLRNLAK